MMFSTERLLAFFTGERLFPCVSPNMPGEWYLPAKRFFTEITLEWSEWPIPCMRGVLGLYGLWIWAKIFYGLWIWGNFLWFMVLSVVPKILWFMVYGL